tara:strand:+ start:860 stop:997 length:138 start_codon:yes stop_codon:yes gene_type:complete
VNKNWGGPYGQDLEFVAQAIVVGFVLLCVVGLVEMVLEARNGRFK